MIDRSILTNNLIAHRGLYDNKTIVENSLKAFKCAIKYKYIIELDVQILKDNNIVVFHDYNLKRLTKVDKLIKDCTLKELKKIKLLDTNYTIPTLQEVLKVVNDQVPILIEIKNNHYAGLLEKELLNILKSYSGRVAIQSFNPSSVYYFKKNRPDILSGLLLSSNKKSIKDIIFNNKLLNYLIKPDFISVNKELLKKYHSKNQLVLGWTINKKSELKKYLKYCDNCICEKFI